MRVAAGMDIRRSAYLACALLAALAAGCGSSSPHDTSGSPVATSGTPAASVGAVRTLRVLGISSVPVDGPPLQVGFGKVWSASSSGLVALSERTARPTVVVKRPIDDVALSSTRVYALSRERRQVVEVDPRSLRVMRRWKVGAAAASVVTTDRDVYVAAGTTPTGVTHIALRTGAVKRSAVRGATSLPNGRSVAVGGGRLWLIDGSRLFWLNPANLSVLGSMPLSVTNLWFGNGSLWAASDKPNGGVVRIDPEAARIMAKSTVDASEIAFAPKSVWLAAANGPIEVDPATARTLAVLPNSKVPSTGSAGIAVVGREVWTTYADLGRLQRVARPKR